VIISRHLQLAGRPPFCFHSGIPLMGSYWYLPCLLDVEEVQNAAEGAVKSPVVLLGSATTLW